MRLDSRLLEVLACPADKGPLMYFEDEASLYNPRLRLRYHIDDGIAVMLMDEADEVGDAEHDRLLAKAGARSAAASSDDEPDGDDAAAVGAS